MPTPFTKNTRFANAQLQSNPNPRQIYIKANTSPRVRNTRFSTQGGFASGLNGTDIDLFAAIQYALDQGWIDASASASIANGSVTNAKLANMATQSFKGRTSAGSGAPEDLTKSQAQAILSVDDLITLSGVADGATNLGTFSGSIFSDNQTIKATFQQIETLLANLNTTTSGSNGLSVTPGTNVSSSSDVSGGYTAVGQELFSRVVSTVTPTSTGSTTITLTQSSFAPYTTANTVWKVNVHEGTNKVSYTITSNANSALITFTAANTNNHTIEIVAQSRLV